MRIDFGNPDVAFLAKLYADEGIEARPVGGAVRDRLLDLAPKDFDFAVDAVPEDVMAVAGKHGLKVIPTGLKHGTVTIVLNDEGYEFTTLRTDLETDGRWATVSFVKDFRLDAERRDFTFNAMSADHTGTLHDYFDGYEDLQKGRVRFVGDADQRVQEDYLRSLRFFRFRARFGNADFDDAKSVAAIQRHAAGLERISVERIWKETAQIMSSERGVIQLASMEALGVAEVIGLPFKADYASGYNAVRTVTNDPAILLGSLFGDPSKAEQFASDWRLSNTDRARCAAASAVVADGEPDAHYWRCKQFDGFPGDVAAIMLAATGRPEAAQAVMQAVPVFPVQARDLLAVGRRPGPQLGAEVRRLTQRWKDSGFSLDKEALLSLPETDEEENPTWHLK